MMMPDNLDSESRRVMSPDELIEAFKNMTLGELAEFNCQFQDTFGVTTDVPQPIIPHVDLREPAVDEPTGFTVRLTTVGPNKISVIKVVRGLLKLGLKESKDLVESAPVDLLRDVRQDVADAAFSAIVREGGEVSVVPSKT